VVEAKNEAGDAHRDEKGVSQELLTGLTNFAGVRKHGSWTEQVHSPMSADGGLGGVLLPNRCDDALVVEPDDRFCDVDITAGKNDRVMPGSYCNDGSPPVDNPIQGHQQKYCETSLSITRGTVATEEQVPRRAAHSCRDDN
jgi:hypothetical protein